MKKNGILNSELSEVIASMGHYHKLVICDAGFPIPLHVQRVDLAVIAGLPPFMDVLKAVIAELQIEQAFVAKQTETNSPQRNQEIFDALPDDVQVDIIDHEALKSMSGEGGVLACIRTGECTPYSNIILVSGVTY